MNALRPFISRLLAPFIVAFVGYLASKGLDLGEDAVAQIQDFATWLILAFVLAGNGIVHRLIDKKANPGDAASSHLAKAEARQAESMKDQANA